MSPSETTTGRRARKAGKRAVEPSRKVRERTQQELEERERTQDAAARAQVRRLNAVHDPSPKDIRAYVNDPAQQATRSAANLARYQDHSLATQLVAVRPDKRGLHTNQLALQIHESRRALSAQARSNPQIHNSEESHVQDNLSAASSTVSVSARTFRPVMPESNDSPLPTTSSQHIIRYPAGIFIQNPISKVPRSQLSGATTKRPPTSRSPKSVESKKKSNEKRPSIGKVSVSNPNRPNSKALEYYSSYLIAKDPLGLRPLSHYGRLAMQDACKELGIDVLVPTKDELRIMRARNTNIRSVYLEAARKYVPGFYKLQGVFSLDNHDTIRSNARRVKWLLHEARFAHLKHEDVVPKGPYMSRIFETLLKECVFKSRQSCGFDIPTSGAM
ncbi:hypothetical protein RhiJN_25159 [Ceratobasidium sp. AG-Ba]|nr:hypothetical protein RhiJN_25159 [Ceratobasidium sp. AG-Ba]